MGERPSPFLLAAASARSRVLKIQPLKSTNRSVDREGVLLPLVDCGSDNLSCLALCCSSALGGDGRCAGIIRRIAAGGIAAFAVELGAMSEEQLLSAAEFLHERGEAAATEARTPSRVMGEEAIAALSLALEIPIFVNCVNFGGERMWKQVPPAKALAAKPLRILLFHDVSSIGHYMLAVERSPLYAERPWSELYQQLLAVMERVETKARATAPDLMASLDAYWLTVESDDTHEVTAHVRRARTAMSSAASHMIAKEFEIETRAGLSRPLVAAMRSAAAELEASSEVTAASDGSSSKKRRRSDATDAASVEDSVAGTAAAPVKKPRAAFDTLLERAKKLMGITGGQMMIADTIEARAYHETTHGDVQCALCRAVLTNPQSSQLDQHAKSKHAPKDENQKQLQVLPRLPMSGKARDAADIMSTVFFVNGMSASGIDRLRQFVPVMTHLVALPADSTLLDADHGMLHLQATQLRAFLKRRLHRLPGSLGFDGSTTHFAGTKKIVNVMYDSVLLPRPMLLRSELESEKSMDAKYYADVLRSTADEYGIVHDDLGGVSGDNTAVIPKAIKLFAAHTNVKHLPCTTHIEDLMVSAIIVELSVDDLLGLRRFLGNSQRRIEALVSRGCSPRLLLPPEHRFAYHIPALQELDAHWDQYATFAASELAGRRGSASAAASDAQPRTDEELERAGTMLEKLQSVEWHARVQIAIALTADAAALIRKSSANARALQDDFWDEFSAWHTGVLADWHANTADRLKGIGVYRRLSAATRTVLIERVEYAVEQADQKASDHLKDPDADVQEGSSIAHLLSVYRERAEWASATKARFASATLLPGSERVAMLGRGALPGFAREYAAFHTAIQRGDGLPMQLAERPAEFWKTMFESKLFPIVSHQAVRVLSRPISSIAAERSFSVMGNVEIDNRLLADELYVKTLLMLSFNRGYLMEVLEPKLGQFYGPGRVPDLAFMSK
jgi:hypothetical protein